jgi:hypothetical protein
VITLTREEAQQVLDALERLNRSGDTQVFDMYDAPVLIPLLRARLAQPEPEPVACAASWFALVMCAAAEIEDASYGLRDEEAKRKAISGAKHYRDAANALYTAPPQRGWQGLTLQEIEYIESMTLDRHDAIRLAAVALQEKNGAT